MTNTPDKPQVSSAPPPTEVLEMFNLWSPPITPFQPPKKKNSSLRMGCVLGNRLYNGLKYEGDLFLLTPQNWSIMLRHASLDFILVESTWFTATGDWYMAMSNAGDEHDQLLAMLETARDLSIPTVFWFTQDHAYHEHYNRLCPRFDHVYCADPREAEALRKEGCPAEYLGPAIQPAIYNPLYKFGAHTALSLGVLYDCWTDILRLMPELGVLVDAAEEFDLSIVEVGNNLTTPQKKRSPEQLVDCILGCVAEKDLPNILKSSQVYLSLSPSQRTETLLSWRIMEAAACRTAVVHRASGHEHTELPGFVLAHSSDRDLLACLRQLHSSQAERQKAAHMAWRSAFDEHCFAKRVQTMCRAMGIRHGWQEHPRASLITPTMRPHLLEKCIRQYEDQTHPDKELVVVYNGPLDQDSEIVRAHRDRRDIKFVTVPQEYHAGTCLNYGIKQATGDYCFRVDDDDLYGPNYVKDAMLYLRASDAVILGKECAMIHFEGERRIYNRTTANKPPCFFRAKDFADPGIAFAGCTHIVKRDFALENKYPDSNASSVDSAFTREVKVDHIKAPCILMDQMNIIVERSSDVSIHTWDIENEILKKGTRSHSRNTSDVLL